MAPSAPMDPLLMAYVWPLTILNSNLFNGCLLSIECTSRWDLGVSGPTSCCEVCDFSGADPGFGQGRPQVLRVKVANVVKWSHASEASNLRWGLEALGFLMLKYAFSHILETLFL